MAKHPGLMRRGMRWYLRTRVPVDLIETIGRREIWRSLETGDAKLDQVQALKAQGVGATEIARRLGIGRASVYRLFGSAA